MEGKTLTLWGRNCAIRETLYALIEEYWLVILSPTIPLTQPEIAALLERKL